MGTPFHPLESTVGRGYKLFADTSFWLFPTENRKLVAQSFPTNSDSLKQDLQDLATPSTSLMTPTQAPSLPYCSQKSID